MFEVEVIRTDIGDDEVRGVNFYTIQLIRPAEALLAAHDNAMLHTGERIRQVRSMNERVDK
jgi:hypothetical protein